MITAFPKILGFSETYRAREYVVNVPVVPQLA